MSQQPLVSIVIPVFNGEKYLAECLDSVRSQVYEELEVIVINDGSTDKSGLIADRVARDDARLKVLHGANSGVSVARNKGIELASGDYIAFVDADDLIHKDYVKNLVNILTSSGADIVSNGVSLSKLTDVDFLSTEVSTELQYRLFNRTAAIVALYSGMLEKENNGQQIMRTSLLHNSGIRYDDSMSIGEDFDFLARAILAADKVAVDDRPMYYYRQNQESAVHQEFNIKHYRAIENIQKAGREVLTEIPELKDALDANLAVNSISYGALMYNKRRMYPAEFRAIKSTIRKHSLRALLSSSIKRNSRIKVMIVQLLGVHLGLILVRKMIRI